MIRLYILALLSIIAMAFGAVMLSGNASSQETASANAAEAREKARADAEAVEATVVKRDPSGQFFIRGEVNGQGTRFLVDTGADMVALSLEEAEQLGVAFDPSTFEPITQTASGPGYGQHVTIDRLDIAGRELENVSAVVVDGLEINLLGQSVLKRLGHIEMRGDQLVIGRS